jgi:N-acetylmuramoyl-L-alanine amidase
MAARLGALLVTLLVAGALAHPAQAAPRRAGRGHLQARTPAARRTPARVDKRIPSLQRARELLAAVKRDPNKRRFRHHWEKAIRALVQAARGKDAQLALLEAARARYGLYRFSAVESDRDEALKLATRATRLGSHDAARFAAAVRREAGDDAPPTKTRVVRPTMPRSDPAPARSGAGAPAAVAASEGRSQDGAGHADSAPAGDDAEDEDEESADAELDKVVADAVEQPQATPGKDHPGGAGTAVPEPAQPQGPAHVSAVKTWSSSDYTRVAVYLSRAVDFEQEEIAARSGLPRRLALDLSPALLDGKALARPVGDKQVDRVRAAQNDADTVRVVLDLAGSDAYQIFSLDDPPRLIVDVGTRQARREVIAQGPRPAEQERPEAPQPAQPQSPASPAQAQATQQPEPQPAPSTGDESEEGGRSGAIHRIVIDAGHGGHDSGAVGPRRVHEKDVVLEMARRLAVKLRGAGFDVVLTRKGDVFLPLEERTAVANTAQGDLFVSIHANAHPRRDRQGIETYFLNVSDDRYARRLAARENGLVTGESDSGGTAKRILADLDARSSAESSARLARLIQREVCTGVRAHVGPVRDLGVKSALFYVLLGARMPAVLVETAFISNREEEKRLGSVRYQEEVAAGITRAVQSYAARESRFAAAR